MGITLFFQYLSTILSLGLGCGTCCSPYISLFLSTYLMSHGKNIKKSFLLFFIFFLGKTTAILSIILFTSFIRKQWITTDGYIGSISLNFIVEISLLVIGVLLIFHWFQEKFNPKKESCSNNCNSHKKIFSNNPETLKKKPLFAVGFFYGITPCAPMMLLVSYALVIPLLPMVILSIIFTIVSSISPMLFIIFISGALSRKMYAEIPKWIDWIRLLCYFLFAGIAIYMLFH